MSEFIQVPPSGTLLTRDYIAELAASVSRVPLSRRQFVEWGTQTLYDWLDHDGVILSGEGEPIDIYPGIFDDAHGDDASGVWVSVLRRRSAPQRRPRRTLLLRLQLYDAIFRIAGRPVSAADRRAEAEAVRNLLRSFSPVWRARYVNEVRKLHRGYADNRALHYGAAVRRLRLRFAGELAAWNASA